ncbi:hypothetical protein SAMN04487829_0968 [Pseudobutyrivibrio sp. NOR37]|uniref:Uncharacterized protein n=1 Tax=Pseudobutyrivibrio xylanivorans TaxID=185007 RepID=A0A6M0LKI3_PSEXY|nr:MULTISPECIES: hypothetical protein [Pseudobutyrivibrio]NEX01381.1 hypothetical protein [Pseudobutyrivibrio xylanivorans]SFR66928.1 hypothetical protein SAMN04487829_0968 [Pseudobutyrivibrio sp. NOR37]
MRRNIIRNLWALFILFYIIFMFVDTCILFSARFIGVNQNTEYVLSLVKLFIVMLMYISSRMLLGVKAQSILKPIRKILIIDLIIGIFVPLIGNVEDDFIWAVLWVCILFTFRYYYECKLFLNARKKITVVYERAGSLYSRKNYKLTNMSYRYIFVSIVLYVAFLLMGVSAIFIYLIGIVGVVRLIIEINFTINFLQASKIYGPLRNSTILEYCDLDDREGYFRTYYNIYNKYPEFTLRTKIGCFFAKIVKPQIIYPVLLGVVIILIVGRFRYSSEEVVTSLSNGYELYFTSNSLPLWTGLDDNRYGIRNNEKGYDSGLIYDRKLEYDRTGIAWYKDRFIDYEGNTKVQLDLDIYTKEIPNREKLLPAYSFVVKGWIYVDEPIQQKEDNSSIKIVVATQPKPYSGLGLLGHSDDEEDTDSKEESVPENEKKTKKQLRINSFFIMNDENNYFEGGHAQFYSSYLNGLGYIDETGKTIVYPEYIYISDIDACDYRKENPYEYMENVYAIDRFGRTSVIDTGTGDVILSRLDSNIYLVDLSYSALSDDNYYYRLIKVYNRKEDRCQYYDLHGNEVVFKDTSFTDRDGELVTINTDTASILGDDVWTLIDDSGNSLFYFLKKNDEYYDDLYYIYDKDGNILVKESLCDYKIITLDDGTNCFPALTLDNKPVLIYMNGKMTEYDFYVEKFFRDDDHNVIFEVRNNSDDDGETFYIDAYGNIIEPNLSE